ncbi:uncharacterized protein MONOS_6304 [Monocercomonoides exilis]|uniref:uncharacterized protein n=1 Tax=Monocercomonoides exilis TaxID=2049356 RepID=UPI0035599F28|nr:hypothetical protein MONOS_6304 [Monocercomonoides exilis]|eukprot:MONOS_6304.1-p1 / transcript=MONOS_6304.1 / gene=MONOS_6304 / organism=Monocercomonoides_exilis_PA203 / gene_product=unspecified product / transcript_product=unspecified product / location=Mono_scaffold00196:85519-87088(-) / protein_length=240 / sequence_SO=supercontig / SO=protein_coding / is_pseudo=false
MNGNPIEKNRRDEKKVEWKRGEAGTEDEEEPERDTATEKGAIDIYLNHPVCGFFLIDKEINNEEMGKALIIHAVKGISVNEEPYEEKTIIECCSLVIGELTAVRGTNFLKMRRLWQKVSGIVSYLFLSDRLLIEPCEYCGALLFTEQASSVPEVQLFKHRYRAGGVEGKELLVDLGVDGGASEKEILSEEGVIEGEAEFDDGEWDGRCVSRADEENNQVDASFSCAAADVPSENTSLHV